MAKLESKLASHHLKAEHEIIASWALYYNHECETPQFQDGTWEVLVLTDTAKSVDASTDTELVCKDCDFMLLEIDEDDTVSIDYA